MKFIKFGWNGLCFEVPEEARFIRFGGDAKEGSLTFESENFFMEQKWEPISEKRRSISTIATELVEKMEQKYKKKGKQSKTQSIKILEKSGTRVFLHDALFMVIKEQVDERFYFWYCDESKRVIIVRFVFKSYDETSKKIIRKIIESFECHREGPNFWSILNFSFKTPPEMFLTEAKIAIGRARITLAERKATSFSEKISRLIIEYYSMANIVFKDSYNNLDEWFRKNYEKDLCKQLKKARIKFKIAEPRKLLMHDLVLKEATRISGLISRITTNYTNATWYCPDSNRIYAVTLASSVNKPIFLRRKISGTEHTEILETLFSSFRCH